MSYNELASKETIEKTIKALQDKGYEVKVVKDSGEALAEAINAIPAEATVMNGSSTTLNEIGYTEYLKEGKQKFVNLHESILKEQDSTKQARLRKQALLSDYYLGSVHALTEEGEMVIASNAGSQLPHLAHSSTNLILVVSTQKIVPNLSEAMKRLTEYVVPKENERSMKAYGVGTQLNKILIFKGESKWNGRKIKIILVEEVLGF